MNVKVKNKKNILAETKYGELNFCSAVNDNNVYGIKVIKQRSPIEISKFLISKYSHDDKEIKWEGENLSKVMKYYASINRNNFTLNLKFFYTTGSKAKNNTEVNFYCKWMPWSQIKESLIK